MLRERTPLSPVAGGGFRLNDRFIPNRPSAELLDLSEQTDRKFFVSEGGSLCRLSPINMVGSMIIATDEDLMDKFMKYGKSVDGKPPIEIVTSDVEISNPEGNDLSVSRVIIKHACGRQKVALVLDGPYAGLFCSNYPFMYPARVWNDHEVGISDPDTPFAKTLFTAREDFRKVYDELIKKMREEKGGEITVLEMFEQLCAKLEIPFDRSTFNYFVERV